MVRGPYSHGVHQFISRTGDQKPAEVHELVGPNCSDTVKGDGNKYHLSRRQLGTPNNRPQRPHYRRTLRTMWSITSPPYLVKAQARPSPWSNPFSVLRCPGQQGPLHPPRAGKTPVHRQVCNARSQVLGVDQEAQLKSNHDPPPGLAAVSRKTWTSAKRRHGLGENNKPDGPGTSYGAIAPNSDKDIRRGKGRPPSGMNRSECMVVHVTATTRGRLKPSSCGSKHPAKGKPSSPRMMNRCSWDACPSLPRHCDKMKGKGTTRRRQPGSQPIPQGQYCRRTTVRQIRA